MINLRPEDSIHKSYLNRLLIEIIDRPILAQNLLFKGGTCASMLGFLDRFSVDLDFDVSAKADEKALRTELRHVFEYLGLNISKKFDKVLFFQVRYPTDPGKRNVIKISANSFVIKSNQYQVQYFPEIDRFINSQTVETMFANKLVALTDRYKLHHTIAGRDLYDIHHFFVNGYDYHQSVILERTGLNSKEYFKKLIKFIKEHITQTIINEDLNALLPNDQFQRIRKILIPETLSFLAREIEK